MKIANSFESTPVPNVGKLNSLPFSESLLTLICSRLSSVAEPRSYGSQNAPRHLGTRPVNSTICINRHLVTSSFFTAGQEPCHR